MNKTLSPPEKWILKGIPVLFLFGSLMHFLYELSGENLLVGLFAPVNESVWEHMKLGALPITCWWATYYIGKKDQYGIQRGPWFTGALVALLSSVITIPLLFYFYTEAFGVESLFVDIFIFFISVLFGQLLGLHFYRYSKGLKAPISMGMMIIVILIFAIFTLHPPHLPLFMDSATGQYGIIK